QIPERVFDNALDLFIHLARSIRQQPAATISAAESDQAPFVAAGMIYYEVMSKSHLPARQEISYEQYSTPLGALRERVRKVPIAVEMILHSALTEYRQKHTALAQTLFEAAYILSSHTDNPSMMSFVKEAILIQTQGLTPGHQAERAEHLQRQGRPDLA